MTGPSQLRLITWCRPQLAVVQPVGRLDLSTHRRLRDGLLKVAAEEPGAIVVNLAGLEIGPPHGLGVFHLVWQQVSEWPGIPMALVVPDDERRAVIENGWLARFLPVCASLGEAVLACRAPPPMRQRQVRLPCAEISGLRARLFVTDACLDWGVHQALGDLLLVTEELVSGVVAAGGPELRVRLRLRDSRLTVSVRDRAPGAVSWPLPVTEQLAASYGRMPSAGGTVTWAALSVR